MPNALGPDALRSQALELARGLEATPKNIARIARETSDEASRWAFTQVNLRRTAQSKFKHSDQMLFTREGLEQASNEHIANYHASRFPHGMRVADLTVGVGADLIALARRGPAVGYEIDPERAGYARHNLTINGVQAEVLQEDSVKADWADYVWADPSRRVFGVRTLDPSSFSPDPVQLAARMRGCKLAGIKLSPMLRDEYLESLGSCLEFVSFAGECREAVVWIGSQAEPGRWAVKAESGERLPAENPPTSVENPERFIYEADPAVIRAHALNVLCEQRGLQALADSNGYLTGAQLIHSNWLANYERISEPTGDLRQLRTQLQRLHAGKPIIKSRTKAAIVPALEKKLKGTADKEVIVMAYGLGKATRYVIVVRR